jgi:hypothetical protein
MPAISDPRSVLEKNGRPRRGEKADPIGCAALLRMAEEAARSVSAAEPEAVRLAAG